MRTRREMEVFFRKYLKNASVAIGSTGELIVNTGLTEGVRGILEDLSEDDSIDLDESPKVGY